MPIDFRCGDTFPSLVLLGACPGQEEANAAPQRPFAGQSAQLLQNLFAVIRDRPDKLALGFQENDFATDVLDDYTLMNSHPQPKWEAQDGRTTPLMSEVANLQNVQRLADQIQTVHARIVVGLGRPLQDLRLAQKRYDSAPMRAIRLLQPMFQGIAFFITGHHSPRAINRYGGGNAAAWFADGLRRFPPD